MNKASLIKKHSLESQAADILRDDIVSGSLPPGTRLVETKLASEYDLSRGTIRSALQQLGSEGLTTQIPYTGWSVSSFTEQDIWELHTLRATLEGMAARLAASKITAAGAGELRQVYTELLNLCQQDDLKAIARADLALHKKIIQLAGHQRLEDQYRMIENQFLLHITASNQDFDPQEVGDSHQDLVDAICAGNSHRAEAEAQKMLSELPSLL